MTSIGGRNQVLDELLSQESDLMFCASRLETFKKWIYDGKTSSCTSEKLAKAGFWFSGSRADPTAATCAFCLKEMNFDATDDPWEEHVSHCPTCVFVTFNNRDESSWTVKDFLTLAAHNYVTGLRQWGLKEATKFTAGAGDIVTMAAKKGKKK